MKYLVIWEVAQEDMGKVIERWREYAKSGQLRKGEKFSKSITDFYYMAGQYKGVVINEATPEQIANDMALWGDCMKMEYIPLVEIDKFQAAYSELNE
jgi:hypothetical protein